MVRAILLPPRPRSLHRNLCYGPRPKTRLRHLEPSLHLPPTRPPIYIFQTPLSRSSLHFSRASPRNSILHKLPRNRKNETARQQHILDSRRGFLPPPFSTNILLRPRNNHTPEPPGTLGNHHRKRPPERILSPENLYSETGGETGDGNY